MRSWPETVSMPMTARTRPSAMEMIVLCLLAGPPTIGAEREQVDAEENSGGRSEGAKFAIHGART